MGGREEEIILQFLLRSRIIFAGKVMEKEGDGNRKQIKVSLWCKLKQENSGIFQSTHSCLINKAFYASKLHIRKTTSM